MSFDLMIFGSSANRAALTNVPMALGESIYSGNGVPGTATQQYVQKACTIAAAMIVSETAACLDVRFHHTRDPAWVRPRDMTRLQTVQPSNKFYVPVGYDLAKGQAVEAQVLNAGAVLDSVGLFVDKGKGIASPNPVTPFPKGYKLVAATATMTCVADQLTPGTVVFEDYPLDTEKKYHIAGMSAHAATGHFTRIKHLKGPNAEDRPGVACCDTAPGLDSFMMFGDFGTFDGLTGIQVEQYGEAADANVQLMFLIKEI